jgi:hypothetical protein
MDSSKDVGPFNRLALLDAARKYHQLGWSLLPIRRGTKKPAMRGWKSLQRQRMPLNQLLARLRQPDVSGVAVVLGKVSGQLMCRDFDRLDAYENWAQAHPELARVLPTAITGRGRHVYGRLACDGRGDSLSVKTLLDGELRIEGAYAILPPSEHVSGGVYTWRGAFAVPSPLELHEFGFDKAWSAQVSEPCTQDLDPSKQVCSPISRKFRHAGQTTQAADHNLAELGQFRAAHEDGGTQESARGLKEDRRTQEVGALLASLRNAPPVFLLAQLAADIVATLPTGTGQRHRCLFELARRLKRHFADPNIDPMRLEPYVRIWWRYAEPVVATKDFEVSQVDFADAWERVRHPWNGDVLERTFAEAKRAADDAVSKQFDNPTTRLLVRWCRILQQHQAEQPFILACRSAATFLDELPSESSRRLRTLERYRVLEVVKRGSRDGDANVFRYLGRSLRESLSFPNGVSS